MDNVGCGYAWFWPYQPAKCKATYPLTQDATNGYLASLPHESRTDASQNEMLASVRLMSAGLRELFRTKCPLRCLATFCPSHRSILWFCCRRFDSECHSVTLPPVCRLIRRPYRGGNIGEQIARYRYRLHCTALHAAGGATGPVLPATGSSFDYLKRVRAAS